MKRSLWCLLVLLVLGCASGGGVSANRDEISKLGPADVRGVTYAPAPFVLATAGKIAAGSLFGVIGGAVAANSMEKAGQEMIATYGVADPALAVRERLAAELQTSFSLHVAPDAAVPASDGVQELKTQFGSGAVLDTRTMGWQLVYYPGDWGHHYLIYAGRARLLRLSDGKVLWEGRCMRKLPEEKPNRHTVDDYKANNGELLKQRVQEATTACADQLIASLEGKPATP